MYRGRGSDGALVAVKTLHTARRDDATWAKRFNREVSALRGLSHQNVVPLIDSGMDPDVGPYLVMPWLDGRTLRQLLCDGPLIEELVLLILRDVASGLCAVHEAGLAHRDLKPDNIMVSDHGQVQLLDFGLAQHADESRVTTAGAVAGSVPYLAPERVDGADAGTSSDIWSLGVIAVELLTGRRPFQRGSPSDEVAAILADARQPIAQSVRASDALVSLIERCLARTASERPNAAALGAELDDAIDWLPRDDDEVRRELIDAERRDALCDPAAFCSRMATLRVATLKVEARRALEGRDHFEALRLVERAMAYRRDDPDLEALLDRAAGPRPASSRRQPDAAVQVASGEEIATPPKTARRLSTGLIAIGVGAVVVAGSILWLIPGLTSDGVESEVDLATTSVPSATASPTNVPSALPSPRPISSAQAFEDLQPLPMALLSNDAAPRSLEGNVAAPGEPIIDPAMFQAESAEQALSFYEAELRKAPDDPPLRVAHALALYAARRDADARRALDAVDADHPNLALVWSARGLLALRRGASKEALALFDKAIALDPKDASSYRNRGILHARLGRLRDGYADLNVALSLDGGDDKALSELANLYDYVGKRELAAPLIRRRLRLTPRSAAIWVDLALAETDLDAKLDALRKAIAIAPRDARAHETLCRVLSQAKKQSAINACDTAHELAPNDPKVYNARGLAHYHQGRDKAALADLDRAIALDGRNAQYFVNRYIVRTHAGQLATAKADLQKACRLGAKAACRELKK